MQKEIEPTTHATSMGVAAKLAHIELTPQQAKQWAETRTSVLWAQPSFSDIWYAMMIDKKGETAWFTDDSARCPVAATDDRYMYLNPGSFFTKYRLGERVFICCHEICHAMFGHCGQLRGFLKRGIVVYPDGYSIPFDNDQFQVAMDMVINAILVESKVGDKPEDACYDANIVPPTMSVVDAYRKIFTRRKKDDGRDGRGDGGKGGSGKVGGGRGFDKHFEPGEATGQTPDEAQGERNETEWRTAIAAAIASAKVQGTLPAGLERLFGQLMEPVVDWTDVLRTVVTKRLGQGGSSWSQLDSQLVVRGIGAPGRVGYGAGAIVCGDDTSGSISQDMMDRFHSEVAAILDDVKPRELYLCQCDAAVHEWVECESSEDLKRKILGGGGTDFRPVFDRVEAEGVTPDILIYFTDGMGCFPDTPPGYPVIWASITPLGQIEYPFGDVVFVPLAPPKP